MAGKIRARTLDGNRPVPIYVGDEIRELGDVAFSHRANPKPPTGMEKEEESEVHLQHAISARQHEPVAGRDAATIPIPDVFSEETEYSAVYHADYRLPRQYVTLQAYAFNEEELPDYDMDSEDERWIAATGLLASYSEQDPRDPEPDPQNRNAQNAQNTARRRFEAIMDKLEKNSEHTVVSLSEAQTLLAREDAFLLIAVYDYWLDKRLRRRCPLLLTVRCEPTGANNPYVAFRRRTEKMVTRKNRKNDEHSFEKMLLFQRSMERESRLFELLVQREHLKSELVESEMRCYRKRFSGLSTPHSIPVDFSSSSAALTESLRRLLPSASVSPSNLLSPIRHRHPSRHQAGRRTTTDNTDATSSGSGSSDTNSSSSTSASEPDGVFTFRRRAGCRYLAPAPLHPQEQLQNPAPGAGGPSHKAFSRFYLTRLYRRKTPPYAVARYARRRTGRGGRQWLDLATSPWDAYLTAASVRARVEETQLPNTARTPTPSKRRPPGPTTIPCGTPSAVVVKHSPAAPVEPPPPSTPRPPNGQHPHPHPVLRPISENDADELPTAVAATTKLANCGGGGGNGAVIHRRLESPAGVILRPPPPPARVALSPRRGSALAAANCRPQLLLPPPASLPCKRGLVTAIPKKEVSSSTGGIPAVARHAASTSSWLRHNNSDGIVNNNAATANNRLETTPTVVAGLAGDVT